MLQNENTTFLTPRKRLTPWSNSAFYSLPKKRQHTAPLKIIKKKEQLQKNIENEVIYPYPIQIEDMS